MTWLSATFNQKIMQDEQQNLLPSDRISCKWSNCIVRDSQTRQAGRHARAVNELREFRQYLTMCM